MAAQPEPRRAEVIRKISELGLNDAVEIITLIALLKEQNSGGVNKKLGEAGARRAGKAITNALIARLVTLIARAYAKTRQGDLHLRTAVEFLEDKTMREIFGSGNRAQKLTEFDAHWLKCRGDHRLPKLNEFRNKNTAHLGEPTDKDAAEATYTELFEFGAATAKLLELLALGTGVAVNPIKPDELTKAPQVFWAPWKQS